MIFVILHKWRESITAGTLDMKEEMHQALLTFLMFLFRKEGMIDAEAKEYFARK